MRAVVLVAMFAGFVGQSASHLVAQETLTLQDVLERTMANSPAYRQALNTMELAGPQARQAWGAFLPTLNVSYGTTESFNRLSAAADPFGNPIPNPVIETRYSYGSSRGLNMSLPLFEGGRRFSELGRARATAALYLRTGEGRLNDVLAEAQKYFIEAQRQKRLLGVEADLLASAQTDLGNTERLFQVASKSRSDVLGAELGVEEARVAVSRAQGAYNKSLLALRTVMGAGDSAGFDVEGVSPSLFDPSALEIEELVVAALSTSHRVLSDRATESVEEANLKVSKAGRWPTISLSGNVRQSGFGNEKDFLFQFAPQDLSGGVSLNVQLPLFSQFRTSYQVAQSRVGLRNAQEASALTRLQVEEEVRSRYVDLGTAWASLQQLERAKEIAQQRLQIVQEEYRLAAKSFEDLQLALRASANAERSAVEQRFAFATALVDLYQAAGIVAERAGLQAPSSESPEGQ